MNQINFSEIKNIVDFNSIFIDRKLYMNYLLLDSTKPNNKILGIKYLLSNTNNRDKINFSLKDETQKIINLIDNLSLNDKLNLFLDLKIIRTNNSRTKNIVLNYVLNSIDLKFKNKYKLILIHFYGNRMSSIIKSILNKPKINWSNKEINIIKDNIDSYIKENNSSIYNNISLILGNKNN